MNETASMDTLVRAARAMLDAAAGRVILGLAGPPGAGKSTAARSLRRRLGADICAVVPMDGFHLPLSVIAGTPRAQRRGAPDTFDGGAFATAVHRIRADAHTDLTFPGFDHEVGDPVADAVSVPAGTPLVVVEGNYLLLPDGAWARARAVFDAVWYLDADPAVRVERLESRHLALGRTPADARRFVQESDERNAALIASTAARADRIFILNADG